MLKNYNERIDKSVKFPIFAPDETSFRDVCCRVKIEKVFCKLQNWDIKFVPSPNTFCDSQFHRKLSSFSASRNQPI